MATMATNTPTMLLVHRYNKSAAPSRCRCGKGRVHFEGRCGGWAQSQCRFRMARGPVPVQTWQQASPAQSRGYPGHSVECADLCGRIHRYAALLQQKYKPQGGPSLQHPAEIGISESAPIKNDLYPYLAAGLGSGMAGASRDPVQMWQQGNKPWASPSQCRFCRGSCG